MDIDAWTLRILMVEDSADDALLVERAFRELTQPVRHLRVADANALREALASFAPHVILSDFSMPGFSGQEAQAIASECAPDVPLLFVSGALGEELAIEAMQRGAADYVLKDNLRRLPSAIERALRVASDRRAREEMQRKLRESEERFRTIVENSRDWIWESETDTRTVYTNGAIRRILGYGPDELLGNLAVEHMVAEDRAQVEARLGELAQSRAGWDRWRVRWVHRDGSVRTLESTAIPRIDAEGRLVGFRGIDHDITEQLAQSARIAQLARIHSVLSELGGAALRTRDRQQLLERVCGIAVAQGGFDAACLSVANAEGGLDLVAAQGDPAIGACITRLRTDPALDAQLPGQVALRERRHVAIGDIAASELAPALRSALLAGGIAAQVALPVGNPPWAVLSLYSTQVQDFDADEIALLDRVAREVDGAVAFMAQSEQLQYLAYHHPATGLPNRAALRHRFPPPLRPTPMVLAAVNPRGFSRINDSRGPEFGDRLLRALGERLRVLVGDGLVVHPGHDVLLLAYPAIGALDAEAERLDRWLGEFDLSPYVLGDEQVFLALQGGLALGPEQGATIDELELGAMAALAEAGKRNLRCLAYDQTLRSRAQRRVEIERDLRLAIAGEQFELFYQPKFSAAEGRQLVGAEALLRWRHPVHGLVSPAEFIPVLEETGLIVQVGRWVRQAALEAALAWRGAGHPKLRIAVNASSREFRHPDFLADCEALLGPHAGAPPLDIEVTESLLMDDIEQCIGILDGLRRLGCRIAIDDFGTGYSSLNYLVRLPADTLKIDQSFVARLTDTPETLALVTNIISLARSLSLDVVAEGVEDEEQAKMLRLLRCDVLQGYWLGRPVAADKFAAEVLGIAS